MRHLHLHTKQVIFILALLFTVLFLSAVGKQVGYAPIVEFMQANPVLGMSVYFIYVILSTVIITLPVVPVWPVALYLYGFTTGVILTMAGTYIGASICFLLARKYGRKLVIKMMGKHLFSEVEHLVHIDNPKTFFLVRLFGNNYFDTISYIAGLSSLSYKSYIAITGFVSTLWIIGLFYLIQRAGGIENLRSFLTIMTGYAVLILIGTIAWEIYHKRHKKKKRKK